MLDKGVQLYFDSIMKCCESSAFKGNYSTTSTAYWICPIFSKSSYRVLHFTPPLS